MKIKLLITVGLTAFALNASATIVNLSGGNGGMAFQDNTGVIIPNGTAVEIGSVIGDVFNPLGSGIITTVFGTAGMWAGTAADNTVGGDPFNGLQIWGRITAADGGVAVFTDTGATDWVFKNNAGGVGDTSNPNSIGIDTFNTVLSSPGFSVGGGVLKVGALIPEPSASLLFACAGLALMVRRKR